MHTPSKPERIGQEDRLPRAGVQALHDGPRRGALVEAPRDAAAQAEEAQAETVGPAPRPRLDPADRAQPVEQPVDAAARLADPLRELDRRRLAVLAEPVDERGGLVEDTDAGERRFGHAR